MQPPRLVLVAVLILAVPLGGAIVSAQSQASAKQQAEALNTQGKDLIRQLDLAGAAQRFRAALALSDDPRFAFNLCYTLEKAGQFAEAKTACERVMASGDARLGDKANRLLASIEESMASGQVSPPPPRTSPPPPPPSSPPVAPAPAPRTRLVRYGAMFGVSRASVSSSAFDTNPKVGVALGAILGLKIRESFATIFDLQLVNRGFTAPDIELTTTYVDVGFASRWHLGSGGFVPYLEAGTTLSVLLAASGSAAGMDFDPVVQTLDFSYTLGVGGLLKVGARSVDLRARYMHGALSTTDPTEINNDAAYNRAILIQAGTWF